jgi:predicted esterase
MHLDAVRRIPGIDAWLVVAVQALHPFYSRDQRIVASWMTREDRELAIADNVDYVGRVLDDVRSEWPVSHPLVFAGFSQGGAMAYRAAAAHTCDAIVVLAADVPPDVAESSAPLPRVLLGRGTADTWYTAEKCRADVHTLATRAPRVEECVFEGGHEWTGPFYGAVGRLLEELQSGR